MTRKIEVLTLSVYSGGMHRIRGKATKANVRWGELSFAESLVPLSRMINAFNKHPLGTKIRVTMETA